MSAPRRRGATPLFDEGEEDEDVRNPATLRVVRPEPPPPFPDEAAEPPAKLPRRGRDVAQTRRMEKMRAERLSRHAAHEEAVARTQRKLLAELDAHVRAHPLYPFADLVNGGLVKSTQVSDVTLIMDTTRAKAMIADLIADLRTAYTLRERVEIEQEERLMSGRSEHADAYRRAREGLREFQATLARYQTIRASPHYLALAALIKSGVRDNVLRRRWNAAQIAAALHDKLLPGDAKGEEEDPASEIDKVVASLAPERPSRDTLLSDLLPDGTRLEASTSGLLLPYASIRKTLPPDGSSDQNVVILTLYLLNLLDPLITSRLYGAREPANPVVNLQLLFSVIIFPAITAKADRDRDLPLDLVRARLKYVLMHMWMEVTSHHHEFARVVVESLLPTLQGNDLSESEADSVAEAGPEAGAYTAQAFLTDLAKFFVVEGLYEREAFWPASLLHILYNACKLSGAVTRSTKKAATAAAVSYQTICTSIISTLSVYFGNEVTLGTLPDLTESDHDFSRDLYDLDALTSVLSLSVQWLDDGSKGTSALAKHARALESISDGWHAQSEALHLRGAFLLEGEALFDAINGGAKLTELRTTKERVVQEEAKRLAAFGRQLSRARGEVALQVLEALDVTESEHTLDDALNLEMERIAKDWSVPSVLRAVMQAALGSHMLQLDHEDEEDILSMVASNLDALSIAPYRQPSLYPACYDLKDRFDSEYRRVEEETQALTVREAELRHEGEARGWLAPDGSEREPTALRLEKEERELKALIDEQVDVSTADLQRSIERNAAAIDRGEGIRLRSDMEIASNVIFHELRQSNRAWGAVVKDAYFLQTSQVPGIIATFADAVSAEINRNQVMSGSRGHYLQNAVYSMNTKRRFGSMETLLRTDASRL